MRISLVLPAAVMSGLFAVSCRSSGGDGGSVAPGQPGSEGSAPMEVEQARSSAPAYKPSSRSKVAVPIDTNAYGAFAAAPDAPEIGDRVEDFELPLIDGGAFALAQARKAGPVVIVFYRGFW